MAKETICFGLTIGYYSAIVEITKLDGPYYYGRWNSDQSRTSGKRSGLYAMFDTLEQALAGAAGISKAKLETQYLFDEAETMRRAATVERHLRIAAAVNAFSIKSE